MRHKYTAGDVLEMAIQIEENGAAFYRRAAELRDASDDKAFLEDLADMEDRHRATFEQMKQQIADFEKTQVVFDPEEEVSLYLKAMADSHGGEGNPDILAFFNGRETMEEVIATAVDLEKESILFYVGLEDIVPAKYGRDKISGIIGEEKNHVAQLSGFLEKVNGG